MKKTILTIILAIALCAMLVACQAAPAESSAPASEAPAATSEAPASTEAPASSEAAMPDPPVSIANGEYTIGFSNASVSNPWRVVFTDTLNYVAENNPNVTLYTTDANEDAQKQLADCEDLISKDIDALVVSPAVTGALAPVIDMCKEKGIPLVVVDRDIGAEGYDAFVRTDGHILGEAIADSVNNYFNGTAKVVYISGIAGSGPDNERNEGFYDQLKKYPGIEVLATQAADWDPTKSLTVMENLLQGYPEMQGVVCTDGTTAVGAWQAIQAANRTDIVLFNMDNTRNDSLQMTLDGIIVDTSVENAIYCGAWAMNVAIDLLNGKTLKSPEVMIPTPFITKDNAAQFMDPSLAATDYPWKGLYKDSMETAYPEIWN